MVRVKALLSTSSAAAAAAPPAQPSRSKLGLLQQQAHLQQGHHHQKQQQGHLQQQQQALSLEVAEDQEVPGVGHFTAYADGRVRVLFSDRTILSLDAGRSWARLILPDGSRQEVPASRPLGVEEYVQVGLGCGAVGGSLRDGCRAAGLCRARISSAMQRERGRGESVLLMLLLWR